MYLEDQQGCSFDDRIDFELSPSDVEDLINLTEAKALDSSTYGNQGLWRDLKDKLQDRYDDWRKQRDKKDRKVAK